MSAAANSRAFDYLDHMLEAITLAMSFTEGMANRIFSPIGKPNRPSSSTLSFSAKLPVL